MRTAIGSWVRTATTQQVEEIYIHMMLESLTTGDYDPKGRVYSVLQRLYSPCSSLKVLSFKHCEFNITQNVQWNQLKRLTITQGLGCTEPAVEHILSGSPQLEVLDLSFLATYSKLNIHSQSLKELSICTYLHEHDNLHADWELEKLILEGTPYSKCLLTAVSSLTHVTIGFSCLHSLDHPYASDFEWCYWTGSDVSALDYVAERFSQVLQTFQMVDDITLFCGCIKVLGAIKEKRVLSSSSFRNVTSLKIGCCYDDYEQLIGILEIFPQLKCLVLQHVEEDYYLDDDYYQDDQKSHKFDAKSYMNLSSSFLLQLKTVDVTWAEGDNIFPFIEVLFRYASKLENIVIRVGENEPPVEKLRPMQRSSPSCKVNFL